MDETQPQRPNYIPTDDEVDEYARNLIDPLLTEAEVAALTDQPDHGIKPVSQHQYMSAEEFHQKENNFHVFFELDNKGTGSLYRRRKAFQRYCALYPELAERTITLYTTYKDRSDYIRDYSPELIEAMFESYQAMSQLIDENDGYIRTGDGELDTSVLNR